MAALAGAFAALGSAALAPSALADAFGEITSWGSVGSGPGQFLSPMGVAVDPTDHSVYALDITPDGSAFRLQKFADPGTGPAGAAIASASIPRPLDGAGFARVATGIAVDPSQHRVYVLESDPGSDAVTFNDAAARIVEYSTQDSGGSLPSAGTIALPDPTNTGAANVIDSPAGLAVDPTTHELLVLGYGRDGLLVIQRVAQNGTVGARYVDTVSSPIAVDTGGSYGNAVGLAVAPSGDVYLAMGNSNHLIWLFQLSSAFDSVTDLNNGRNPSDVAIAENWQVFGGVPPGETGATSQLAISPDGGTLYWTETGTYSDLFSATPGSYNVRAYSIATGRTSVLYGGGTGTCAITASGASLAADTGGVVYAFDAGNFAVSPPTFGATITKFGPGGSGCPIPDPRFTVNGSTDSTVTVQKGSTVQFLADTSHLNGASATELDWDLDGSGTFGTVVSGPSPDLSETFRYLQPGDYRVSLRMQMTGGAINDLPPVTKTVTVVAGTPTAAFGASTTSPAAGATVTFDASTSVDPTGSASAGPTNRLRTYSWDFGDGTTQTTSTPTVQHAFANADAAAVNRTVRLTVTSFDGVDSAPASQTIAVQGTPVVTTPITTPIITPPPVITGPGKVSLLAAAVKGTSAALTLRCAASPGACTGTLTLVASLPTGKKGKTRATVVGSASFSLGAGGKRSVTVKLSKAARALLASRHRLKLTVRIVTRNSAGVRATASKTATLVLPVRKSRRR